nr:MAG: hypothetical protein DIU55_11625 [Bacillota bacterium]
MRRQETGAAGENLWGKQMGRGQKSGQKRSESVFKRRTLAHVLVFTSFYDQLAWSPIVAWLAVSYGAPDAAAWAATAYSAANLFGNVLFGMLADAADRMAVAGVGLVAMVATSLAHLLPGSTAGLVGVRALHGLAIAGVAPAAMASITDGLPRNQRGAAMARMGLVIAVASMLATAISGRLLTSLGAHASVYMLALLAGTAGAFTFAIRRWLEPPPARARDAVQGEPAPGRVNMPGMLAAGLVAYALMFLQNVLFYAYPLKGHEVGLSSAIVGMTLSAFGLGAVIAFVPPLSRASDRWGRHQPIFLGMALAGAGHLGLHYGTTPLAFAVSLFIYGLGFGLVFPAVSALNADAAGAGRRGVAFGLLSAAFSLGSISGPPVTQALSGLASPFSVAGLLGLASAGFVSLWYYLAVRPAQEAARQSA